MSRVKLKSNQVCATCQPAAHRVETDSTCQSAANNAQHEGENLHQTAGLSPIKDNKHTATCTAVQHHNQQNNMNLGPGVMGHSRNHTMSRVMENHSHSVPRSLQLDSCLAQASSLCNRLDRLSAEASGPGKAEDTQLADKSAYRDRTDHSIDQSANQL